MYENLLAKFLNPRNFYLIITVAFVIWVGFFDRNDVYSQYKMFRQQKQLESEKQHYQSEIQIIHKQKKLLTGDSKALEQYAREKFRMKRKGEDVYVITE